jgi:hypothetical protein
LLKQSWFLYLHVVLPAAAPVQDIPVFAVFALVQLGRVMIVDRAWLGQGKLVPFVWWVGHKWLAAFLARKSPWL